MMEWVALSAGRCGSEYVEYSKKEVDNNVIVSDRDIGGMYTDMLTGKKFSQQYDVSNDCIKYLLKKMEDYSA